MRKIVLFALLGALGCTVGAAVGEVVLRLGTAPANAEEPAPPAILFSEDVAARLKQANAGNGNLEVALFWENTNDLDLLVTEPSGEEISFRRRKSQTGGELDVDRNDAPPYVKDPVEHVVWKAPGKAPFGKYQVVVNYRARRERKEDDRATTAFRVEVVAQGDIKEPFRKTFNGAIAKGEKATAGEFEVEAKPVPKPSMASLLRAAAVVSAWTAGLATCLALALVVGQNWYLRRPLVTPGAAAAAVLGGLVAGAVAGGAGQLLFGYLGQLGGLGESRFLRAEALAETGRFAGWFVLGGLLGAGMGVAVPNLSVSRAAATGAVGGLAAAWAFVDLSRAVGDTAAHFAGAGLLGLFVGLAVALVEVTFRRAWLEVEFGPKEIRTVALGRQPVTLGTAPGCTVYVAGAAPVASRYRFENGAVVREDVAAGTTTSAPPGDVQVFGKIRVRVRAATAGSGKFALRVGTGDPIPLTVGRRLLARDLSATDPDPNAVVAEVAAHPQNPDVLGLKNLGRRTWAAAIAGTARQVDTGRSVGLSNGTQINFGTSTAVIEELAGAPGPGPRSLRAGLAVVALVFAALFAVDWARRNPETAPAGPGGAAGGAGGARPEPTEAEKVARAVFDTGHTEAVHAVAFSPDGRYLASGGHDKRICLWDVREAKLLRRLDQAEKVLSVSFSRDSRRLVAALSNGKTVVWGTPDGGEIGALADPPRDPQFDFPGVARNAANLKVACSPDADLVAGGGNDGRVRLWRLSDRSFVGTFDGEHDRSVSALAWRPDGLRLVTAGTDHTVRLWDVERRAVVRTVGELPSFCHAVAIDRRGEFAAGSCCQNMLPEEPYEYFQLFPVRGGKGRPLPGHTNCVTALAFSPTEDDLLASGGSDRVIKFWRAGVCLDTYEGHAKEIWTIAFSPDGKLLASGGNDYTVRLWHVRARR